MLSSCISYSLGRSRPIRTLSGEMVAKPDPSVAPMIRRTVYFSGNVQGVGFRYTTQHTACDFHVTGYVRNLPDGRVEVVAEGEARELDQFIARIENMMNRQIREAKSSDSPATGEFVSFRIER